MFSCFAGGEFLGDADCREFISPLKNFQHCGARFEDPLYKTGHEFGKLMTDAAFSQAQADEMNAALTRTTRYDFDEALILKDENGTSCWGISTNSAIRNFMGR